MTYASRKDKGEWSSGAAEGEGETMSELKDEKLSSG
jgi:hypothetical protein